MDNFRTKFDLFKKKGQVAPKCGSAKIRIVKKIKYNSYPGKAYKKTPYIIGNIKET